MLYIWNAFTYFKCLEILLIIWNLFRYVKTVDICKFRFVYNVFIYLLMLYYLLFGYLFRYVKTVDICKFRFGVIYILKCLRCFEIYVFIAKKSQNVFIYLLMFWEISFLWLNIYSFFNILYCLKGLYISNSSLYFLSLPGQTYIWFRCIYLQIWHSFSNICKYWPSSGGPDIDLTVLKFQNEMVWAFPSRPNCCFLATLCM